MNQEVGSIMSCFYKLFPVKVYDKPVKEGFQSPSMYFPEPFSFDTSDTVSTFRKTFSLSVKLFHKDSQQASDEGEKIADSIRAKRNLIPLLNADGTNTGEFIRVSRIETRVTDGVASIVLTWDSRYFYEREVWPSLETISMDSGVK